MFNKFSKIIKNIGKKKQTSFPNIDTVIDPSSFSSKSVTDPSTLTGPTILTYHHDEHHHHNGHDDPNAGRINGNPSVCVGSTTTYTSTGDKNGTWSSSNTSIATITSKGVVTGISEGDVELKYSVTKGHNTEYTTKSIIINTVLNSGVITGDPSVCVGSTTLYTTDGNSGGIWCSDDDSIASVNEVGLVTGISDGSTTIKYSITNICGVSSTGKNITINPLLKISEITGETPIFVGESVIYLNDNKNGFWSSNNPDVATVDSTGLVTGVSKGTSVITYTVKDICGDVSVSKNVVVKEKDRVLFILKSNSSPEYTQSYGLYNSSKMIVDYLEKTGNVCKITTIIDTNSIQNEVYDFKPTVVVFEALWISGSDVEQLIENPDFKNIKWVIRIHSNIGFLAAEPWAFKFIQEYINLDSKKVIVSCNNREFVEELSRVCNYNFKYLPDIMTSDDTEDLESTVKSLNQNDVYGNREPKEILHIGSFGALRVLKNQLFQAMCSILTADKLNMTLHFHVNGDTDSYNPVLLNLKELFEINGKHKLVLHDWLEHDEFNDLIKQMDMGLQLSYTESFNIVTADFVFNEIPILVSETIDWMPRISMVSDVDYDSVVNRMKNVYIIQSTLLLKLNKFYLFKYNTKAKIIWDSFIK